MRPLHLKLQINKNLKHTHTHTHTHTRKAMSVENVHAIFSKQFLLSVIKIHAFINETFKWAGYVPSRLCKMT